MGERERQDGLKALEGKVINVKRWRLLDFLLYPYRAYKEKKRQEDLRRRMVESIMSSNEPDTTEEVQ